MDSFHLIIKHGYNQHESARDTLNRMLKRKSTIILFFIVFILLLIPVGLVLKGNHQAEDINLSAICTDSNGCPSQYCTTSCGGGGDLFGCAPVCVPKDCFMDFDAQNCPVGPNCSVWKTSSGNKVCYYNHPNDERDCGEEGYYGQKFECCKGYIRGVGTELKDGACDMNKGGYEGIFPYCIACGDGQCSKNENRCNCPADCN